MAEPYIRSISKKKKSCKGAQQFKVSMFRKPKDAAVPMLQFGVLEQAQITIPPCLPGPMALSINYSYKKTKKMLNYAKSS
jgi:hypothetical protein